MCSHHPHHHFLWCSCHGLKDVFSVRHTSPVSVTFFFAPKSLVVGSQVPSLTPPRHTSTAAFAFGAHPPPPPGSLGLRQGSRQPARHRPPARPGRRRLGGPQHGPHPVTRRPPATALTAAAPCRGWPRPAVQDPCLPPLRHTLAVGGGLPRGNPAPPPPARPSLPAPVLSVPCLCGSLGWLALSFRGTRSTSFRHGGDNALHRQPGNGPPLGRDWRLPAAFLHPPADVENGHRPVSNASPVTHSPSHRPHATEPKATLPWKMKASQPARQPAPFPGPWVLRLALHPLAVPSRLFPASS